MNDEHKKIAVVMCNVNRSNPITHSILHNIADNFNNTDIIIITEPWIGVIRSETQEKGTVNHPAWRCYVPRNVAKADVAIYLRKESPLRITPLPSHPFATNKHTLTVQVSLGDNFMINLIAAYNSPSKHNAFKHLVNSESPETPTVMCGDFNLHAPEWDTTVERADTRAEIFQDWLADNFFQVMNDPNKPTSMDTDSSTKKWTT
jgi:hypothetical protein